jgi:hypothetical protein
MMVYVYNRLVDIFGDVPYSQALDIDNISPAYDDAFTIYKDLIARTDAAIAGLNNTYGSFGSDDLLFGGDIDMWVKFARSLNVKMGITIADHDQLFQNLQLRQIMVAHLALMRFVNFNTLVEPTLTNYTLTSFKVVAMTLFLPIPLLIT